MMPLTFPIPTTPFASTPMKRTLLSRAIAGLLLLAIAAPQAAQSEEKKPLRAGMIGLDTSHVVAFAGILNTDKGKNLAVPIRLVAAYPAGSKDLDVSSKRIEGFTKTLKEKYGVEMVDSIDELLKKVDVVFLESVDGRPHLQQAIPVLKAKKPLFIDKPMAISLADVIRIFDLAKETGTPVFSSSSLRFFPTWQTMRTDPKVTKAQRIVSTGAFSLLPHHPDMYWYGIHGIEALYSVMGPGCVSVSRESSKDLEVVTGTWKDGRVGVFRGAAKLPYAVEVTGPDGTQKLNTAAGYDSMMVEIAKFFQTGKSPIAEEETIELFAFMEAADESKKQGGAPVKIETVIAKARAEVAKQQK